MVRNREGADNHVPDSKIVQDIDNVEKKMEGLARSSRSHDRKIGFDSRARLPARWIWLAN